MNHDWLMSSLAIMRLSGYDKFRMPWWVTPACVLCLVLLIVFWKVLFTFLRWMRSPIQSPERLMMELMRVHKLSVSDRKMMQRMADKLPKDSGSFLFVDPNLWPLESDEFQEIRNDQDRLYEKIFGFPPERNRGV